MAFVLLAVRGATGPVLLCLLLLEATSAAMSQDHSEPIIAIAPIGSAPANVAEMLAPAIRGAFGAEVILAAGVPLSASAFDGKRRQYLSTSLLDDLAKARLPGWERLLGIADVDLYVPQLNFVFGEADPRRGVAVFSLTRLNADRETLFRRRAATEAIHELGHTYGLAHCADPRCVMWFSNTLSETDRKGMRFCPAHNRELAAARARAATH